MIGRTISHYRILDKLGAGGMGEVYLAHDLRLQRRVALKLLPAELAARRERLERFKREATLVAALDHPNIVTVFSIEEADGLHFITMQLVSGRPLSRRIPRQGLPLEAFFDIAVPVADAVAAAHAKGIVHRDLKPANIMLGDDGQVAVLDFGLAKLLEDEPRAPASSRASTSTTPLTRAGQAPGTAAYMSPEQAAGGAVDHRSDIFSLAIVLYEMATGRRPFEGSSQVELRAAILAVEPPPVTALRPDLPRHLGRIIARGLEKDPPHRYQSVLDMRNDLAGLRRESESGDVAPVSQFDRGRRGRTLLLTAVALLAAGVLASFLYRWRAAPPTPALRALPLTSWSGSETQPALSPRGDQIAFLWDRGRGSGFDLYVMLLGADEPLQLTRESGRIGYPAWSPRGDQIAFVRRANGGGGQVVSIPALGGKERVLWSTPESSIAYLDWSPGGAQLAFVERRHALDSGRILLLSTDSGETAEVAAPPHRQGVVSDRLPVFAPDGLSLAYVRWYEAPRSEIYLQPLPAGEPRLIVEQSGWIQGMDWMPDASALLFSTPWQGATGLWRSSLAGKVTQLGFGQEAGDLTVAASGDRLVFSQDLTDANVWRIAGPAAALPQAPRSLIASTRDDWAPRYSPDGERIALVSNRSGDFQIWICHADGDACSPYATPARANWPCWSPDGRQLAFSQQVGDQYHLFVGQVDGGFPRQLTWDAASAHACDWSADGRWIYFYSARTGANQIWRVPAGGGTPQQVTEGGGMLPLVSDDHRYVYLLRAGPPAGIWRRALAGGRETLLVEREGLSRRGFALWRGELFYAVRVGNGTTEVERLDPRTGASAIFARLAGTRQGRLSVSPDGRWLVYAQNDARGADLILVENLGG